MAKHRTHTEGMQPPSASRAAACDATRPPTCCRHPHAQESKVQWVKEKVEEWQQSLRFEPKAAQA